MKVSELLPVIIFLGVAALCSVRSYKLTVTAALTGVLLALADYAGDGFTGLAMMAVFFLAGTAATSWKLAWKRQQGLSESEKGTRTPGQVVANAGVAALAGLTMLLYPSRQHLLQLMIAAAFSAATADTLSSELGNVYGRRFYNILGFKKDQRGLNGVVSLEGFLCGLAGSIGIAGIYAAGTYAKGHFAEGTYTAGTYGKDFNVSGKAILIVILAGTIGNLFDSLLGATWERRQYIGNNTVNFLNTALAAMSAWLLAVFI